jgi:hypothetical protein
MPVLGVKEMWKSGSICRECQVFDRAEVVFHAAEGRMLRLDTSATK